MTVVLLVCVCRAMLGVLLRSIWTLARALLWTWHSRTSGESWQEGSSMWQSLMALDMHTSLRHIRQWFTIVTFLFAL